MNYTHQPYRGGVREPTDALKAMLMGRPQFLPHPLDAQRRQQRALQQYGPLYQLLLQQR